MPKVGCATLPLPTNQQACRIGGTIWIGRMFVQAPLHGKSQCLMGNTRSRPSQPVPNHDGEYAIRAIASTSVSKHTALSLVLQVIFPRESKDGCKVQGVSTGGAHGNFAYENAVSVTTGRISISGDSPDCHSIEEVQISKRGKKGTILSLYRILYPLYPVPLRVGLLPC